MPFASLLGLFLAGIRGEAGGSGWARLHPANPQRPHGLSSSRAAVRRVSGSPLQVNKLILALAFFKRVASALFRLPFGFNETRFPRDVLIIAKNVKLFLLSFLSFWSNNNKTDQEQEKRGVGEGGLWFQLQELGRAGGRGAPLCFLAGGLER